MDWRSQKRQMRQTVHATMRVPCWRISSGAITAVHARLHTVKPSPSNSQTGDLMNVGYAETAVIDPSLLFMLSECDPKTGDVFVFSSTEAYRVEVVMPKDDITVKADVTVLPREQLAKLPPLTFPVVVP